MACITTVICTVLFGYNVAIKLRNPCKGIIELFFGMVRSKRIFLSNSQIGQFRKEKRVMFCAFTKSSIVTNRLPGLKLIIIIVK